VGAVGLVATILAAILAAILALRLAARLAAGASARLENSQGYSVSPLEATIKGNKYLHT